MKTFRLLLAAALAMTMAAAAANYAPRVTGVAQKTLDGDDFIFAPDDGGAPFQVRLCGVDAPPLSEEPGLHARAALEMMLKGKHLYMDVIAKAPPIKIYEKDGKQFAPERDLAVVHIVEQQAPVNLMLVAGGHARHMYLASFCGKHLPAAHLDQAESGARAAARGIWAL